MSITSNSISVVVPVHNAERTLNEQISRLLEVLPDLAPKFEVLIVDDGSTDLTEEVALEISHRYPQVRVTRHAQQLGIEESAQTGAALTTGDIVIVHAGQEPVNSSQLQEMWQDREDEELVVAPVGSHIGGISSEVLRELENWGHGVTDERIDLPTSGGVARTRVARPPATPNRSGTTTKSVPAPIFQFNSDPAPTSMHQ